jgi:hypothetical protein
VARKKREDEKDEVGNLLELKKLGEEGEKLARHLGYREKCSVNNIARLRAHELYIAKLSKIFVLVLGLITAGFAIGAFAAEESEQRHKLLGVAVFVGLWVVLSAAYGRRAKKLAGECDVLEKVVREKLGK